METSFQNTYVLFFVMQLVQGGELRGLLNSQLELQKKGLTEETVRFYAVQIIDAVMNMHERGYVHRDLKLENVLVDKNGYLVIIDFGVSKRLDSELCMETLVGTKGYMAPELTSN